MFELAIMQESFVTNATNLLLGLMVLFGTVSGIAIFWAMKARNALAKNPFPNSDWDEKAVKILDDYVLPLFKKGQEVAEATQKQEVKIKQFGEILYGMFPEQAAQIKDKYEVKLVNLQKDIENATQGTVEYNEKVKELEQILSEIRGSVGQGAPLNLTRRDIP